MSSATVYRTLALALAFPIMLFGASLASDNTVGLLTYEAGSFDGYTLFNPNTSSVVYMIDNYGRVVHTWETEYSPSLSAYLLPNGDLLRPISFAPDVKGVQQLQWDGTVVWEFEYEGESFDQHHDIEALPNGNVLILAREVKTAAEAIQAGRDPLLLVNDALFPEYIVEVSPTGPTTGEIVWEWHAWDHLIQDYDPAKDNYGVVRDHPELIDLNFANDGGADWLHANSVAYNPQLDQIVISCNKNKEFWIIDHSTTTAEAAGHSGGNGGSGGDLLYRWGNPQSYRLGDAEDQRLFRQHDVHWIPPGFPGEGHILLFNNGGRNSGRDYSSVDEIVLPVDVDGNYSRTPGQPFGPDEAIWSYTAENPMDFFAGFISGAQRLANGNTLVCSGPEGWFFEVTPDKDIVWEYINPAASKGIIAQGEEASGNAVFRCRRYAPDYSGLVGREVEPEGTLELDPVEIAGTSHFPSSPSSVQQVYVTSLITADSGLASVELYVDTGDGFTAIPMLDDGHHSDSLFGDGIFGAIIGIMPENAVVSYYVRAVDDSGHVSHDPTIAPEAAYGFSVVDGAFVSGDADGSGEVDIDDVVFLVNYIFSGGDAPDPILAADVDCSDYVDIDDVVYLVAFIFVDGPMPGDPDGDGELDC